METPQPAKLLRIHCAEHDKYEGRPLYEVIVEMCREMSIAGATVFRGLEGYGETTEMHRAHLLRHDQPIVVTVIDIDEKIIPLLTALEGMIDTGLMALSDVEFIRIRRAPTE